MRELGVVKCLFNTRVGEDSRHVVIRASLGLFRLNTKPAGKNGAAQLLLEEEEEYREDLESGEAMY